MTATPLTPERLREIAALCVDARDTFGEVTTQRQLGGLTIFCKEPRCVSEQPCWKHDEPRLQRAYTVGREFMQAIPELLAEIARLQSDLDHATAHDGDHLSKASRRMVDTVMGDRDALRAKVEQLTETARAASENWMAACQQRDEARSERDIARSRLDIAASHALDRDARITALETGLREACNWIADRSPDGSILVDRLLAVANNTTKETT